jgi:hypothetical protein
MPRCRTCKEKFEPKQFNQKNCFENTECIKAEVELKKKAQKKQWNKEKKVRKEKLKTASDYIRELQTVFNRFIRLRDKEKNCISCNKPLRGKYDAGHFYSTGSYPEVRFNEDNVHGQCVHCNQHKRGNIHEYRKGLIIRIGEERLQDLEKKLNTPKHYNINELQELKEIYKKKIKNN